MKRIKFFSVLLSLVLFAGLILRCTSGIATGAQAQIFFKSHSSTGQDIFAKPDDALRAYQSLEKFFGEKRISRMTDIKKFSEGFSGAVIFEFVLDDPHDDYHYIGRLSGLRCSEHDFLAEIEAQLLAASIGYAPKIYYHDASARFVVMERIQGKNLSLLGITHDDESWVKKLAQTLRGIHGIGQEIANSYGFAHIHCYESNKIGFGAYKHVGKCREKIANIQSYAFTQIDFLRQYIIQLRDVVDHLSCKPVLTHNDCHKDNILVCQDDELCFIDWTDAGFDNPLNDCAIVSLYYSPAHDHEELFLTTYFGRPATMQEKAAFRLIRTLCLAKGIAWLINRYLDHFCKILEDASKWEDIAQEGDIWWYFKQFCVNKKFFDPNSVSSVIKAGLIEIKRYMDNELEEDKKLLVMVSI